MLTHILAKTLRLLPNQEKKAPMVSHQQVKDKREIIIETSVKDTYISCYYPLGAADDKLPVYMNFHGGAFIMNEKEMDDPYCRQIANHTGCMVINVDYAKAPEYPFPAPVEEAHDIIQWVRSHAGFLGIDPERVAVGGQSSGANIAAALCLLLKNRQEPQPTLQVLCYPMLDFVTPHANKPEPDPYRAKLPQVANFLNKCYVPNQEKAQYPLASPVMADDVKGAAQALIVVGEYDAFNPEAVKYADKLKEAGVSIRFKEFENCTHAFTHLGPKVKAEEAWSLIEDEIREASKAKD
ncbi:alpha/beta hydrolase [Halobacillus sp. A5]|uniref:alpha/beta hydrolase n=1 Tax=Halobacillus sp. A5 TaxID=2880263 RepID=UPI0020A69820|nr:alpha/beta hydrolase [Halobacillus sp. A5]MCP3027357.1 alpha/beta hydrolase [Halobacillus sp. A5]